MMNRFRIRRLFLAAAILCFFLSPFVAVRGDDALPLTAESLNAARGIPLHQAKLRYRAGDDLAWAAKDYDDGGWKDITNDEINARPAATLENWRGRGWFRLRVDADESIAGRPLALSVSHWGAAEIYLDGQLVARFGEIEARGERAYNPRGLFVPLVFASRGVHVFAVRQSYTEMSDMSQGRGHWLLRIGPRYTPGALLTLTSGAEAAQRLENLTRNERFDYCLIGLLLALALLHFLLFVFYRDESGNLLYSLFAAAFAATIWLVSLQRTAHAGAIANLLLDIARQMTQAAVVMSLLAFLSVAFAGRLSRFFWVLAALWIVCGGLLLAQIYPPLPYLLLTLIITLAECVRVMAAALARRRPGAWVIGAGVIALVIGVAINVTAERRYLPISQGWRDLNLYLTILSIPLAVSFYLARNFARTNLDLAARLRQVEDLSEKQIVQERREAELRVEHERTRAESERRARELEEARQLQLSMLPSRVPQLPDVEVAAYMKTASEVGGDYYDFHAGPGNTLTVVIGDATGHGLKAGTIVTATKSLFAAFAAAPRAATNVVGFLRETSSALKAMNLRSLFMSLAVVVVKDGEFLVAGAGMPPALLWRAADGSLEEVKLNGAPLGSVVSYPYREQRFDFAPGDVLFLMSDGCVERFNELGEMFDDERARDLLRRCAAENPEAIIERFVAAGEEWAGDRPPDDDITFVVLRRRLAPARSTG